MIFVVAVIAILWGAFAPSAPVEQAEAPPEVKVVEVTDMTVSDIENAAAKKGWYKKSRNGLSYWGGEDDPSIDAVQAPPTGKVTASMNSENAETIGGLVILAILGVVAWKISRSRKRETSSHGDGVSQIQYQALLGELAGMNRILKNIVPDGNGAKAVEKRKRR